MTKDRQNFIKYLEKIQVKLQTGKYINKNDRFYLNYLLENKKCSLNTDKKCSVVWVWIDE